MQVNLNFDTEKESLDNLKKLVDALTQLIAHRQGQPMMQVQQQPVMQTMMQQQASVTSNMPPQVQAAPVQAEAPADGRTGGGCRVVPYEDMTSKMSSIFSGRRY